MIETPNEDGQEIEPISKSQIKRDMDALQNLGVRLMELNKTQLSTIPLNDYLIAALNEAKRITSHEAKRRHAQYMGKLIRNTDFEAIFRAVDLLDPSSEEFSRFHQQLEKWRDRFTEDVAATMTDFLNQYPLTDRQHLRQLAKNADNEAKKKPTTWTARKKLFQYIKEVATTKSGDL